MCSCAAARGWFVLNVAKRGGGNQFQLEIWNGPLLVTKYCCLISYLVHCVCFLGVGPKCVCGACVCFRDPFIHSSTWTLGRQQPLRATPFCRLMWQEITAGGGGDSNVLTVGTSWKAMCLFELGHWHKFCATFGRGRDSFRQLTAKDIVLRYSELRLEWQNSHMNHTFI